MAYQFNPFKLYYHTDPLLQFINGDVVMPIVFELSLSGKCSHNCLYCACMFNKSNELLSKQDILEIIDQVAIISQAITITGGGEPSENDSLIFAVEYAHSKGLSVGLITNGANLSVHDITHIKQFTKYIRISVDTLTEGEYCRIRGVGLSVFNHLRRLLYDFSQKRETTYDNCQIGAHIVWVDQSKQDIDNTITQLRSLNLDFIQLRPVDNIPGYELPDAVIDYKQERLYIEHLSDDNIDHYCKVIPNIDKFDDYFNNRRMKHYSGCKGANFTASIGHDNRVYFCCSHIGDPRFCLGDLRTQTLVDIMRSNFRKRLIADTNHTDCQLQCRNHHMNRILMELDSLPTEQVNHLVLQYKNLIKPLHYEFL